MQAVESTQRIQVLRDVREAALFAVPALAPPSPSSSLLIEPQRLTDVGWLTHCIPSHVLTMLLQPCEVLHADQDGPVSRFVFGVNTVAVCAYGQEESVRWSAGSDALRRRAAR